MAVDEVANAATSTAASQGTGLRLAGIRNLDMVTSEAIWLEVASVGPRRVRGVAEGAETVRLPSRVRENVLNASTSSVGGLRTPPAFVH